jgi:predicted amidohydrolase YtcJ
MDPADLILTRANLITLDDRLPRASAMAIRAGRICCVGDDRTAGAFAGLGTRKLDLAGRAVTPGFCDAHVHLYAFGLQALRQADLVGCASIDQVLSRLSDQSRRRDGWILGYGFDQDKLAERRFPTRAELDRIAPDRPVLISRICGHAVVVNSGALALATPQQRTAGDADTGFYTEEPAWAFYAHVPPPDEAEAEQAVLVACRQALRSGITSAQTLLDTADQMSAYARLRRKGKLPIRITGMPPYAAAAALHAHGVNTTFGDDRLRFGAVKLFSDGSLGARTAWMSQPYADDPSTRGMRIYDPDVLKSHARDAQSKGFQLAIHAIGDQALRETLDAIEAALGDDDNAHHRHRVEHASITPPDCMDLLAGKRIVVTAQPQFVRSDSWTPDRLGPERSPWAYPFATMLRRGVPIALSSDCPVERLDAFACLAAAVGRAPWSPHECLTVEQALRAYCLGGAYAGHAEDRLGSLEVGKLADFVVLSEDPTKLDAEGLAKLKAEQVFVGGEEAVLPSAASSAILAS